MKSFCRWWLIIIIIKIGTLNSDFFYHDVISKTSRVSTQGSENCVHRKRDEHNNRTIVNMNRLEAIEAIRDEGPAGKVGEARRCCTEQLIS